MDAPTSPWITRLEHKKQEQGFLQKTRFAVKGMIPVEGQAPSLGNPAWDAQQSPAQSHAAAVMPLLLAGAQLVGTTRLDELALGITGANQYTGTPVNPSAPNHVPGGSSSGSAVVVASDEADFALGTDTGGSIRVPASWCGIVGWRPTHGLIPVDSVPVHSPSLDVVGVLARSVNIMEVVGHAYGCQGSLRSDREESPRMVFLQDLWQLSSIGELGRSAINQACKGRVEEAQLSDMFAPLEMTTDRLTETFLHIGMFEVASARAQWVKQNSDKVSSSLCQTIDAFQSVTAGQYQSALETRNAMRATLDAWLEGRVLVFPTTPGPAPLRETSSGNPADVDNATVQTFCALSSITGFPQVTFPLPMPSESAPCGVSLLGRPGQDMALMQIAKHILSPLDSM